MSSLPKPIPPTEDDDLLYPSEDGVPMGETDWHMWALMWLREALEDYFADRDDVKVASDMFLYYREGDPSACKAPDIMVAMGVANHWRRTFKTWVEKAVPNVIVEIASEKTYAEDLREKRDLYERLGVKEYFVFDPEARCLKPPLQGFRRKGKRYEPLAPAADGTLLSQELGLLLRREGPMVRLRDARTGEPILTRAEAKEQAERRAEQEKRRGDALEAELARLKAKRPRKKS